MSSTKFYIQFAFIAWTATNLYFTAFGLNDLEMFVARFQKMVL